MNSDYALKLRSVERHYKSGAGMLEVLKGADLDLKNGEVVGLVGPSGSGKSSLLHAAGLLEKPSAGYITIDGEECEKLSDSERTRVRREKLGFVYQFHHLLPEFSAIDNTALPLLIGGMKRSAAREQAERLLVVLGLQGRLEHQPGQLSGGEQQRVAIARALVNKPRLILADEPTGNLDPDTSKVVFDAMFQLTRAEGAAAIIATHNHELAGAMDRVVTLKQGRVEAWN
ncbi:MAG: ABC transporter ATP-binding protein, partial [Caulobacterales bacterium]